ncbi:TPA: threonine--tRNA ligase [Legionella pneumophila]|uniref:threonine--tRNA ligase n=1 Tax=Legionella pneumophila TaxID=446 RepID=UPI000777628A|nr:threonine--tRNA ligase [Legionella pneumophila]HAT8648938.1 threonine--tRNA ligase [Legionella pneumophila]
MDQHLSDNLELLKIRHSCEHVLTQAMEQLFPGILKASGPATQDGFYFDFECTDGMLISEHDFPKIEEVMAHIIKQNLTFHHKELTLNDAQHLFKDNPYKLEWLEEIKQKKLKPTVYWTGDAPDSFFDLCAGPHVHSTREIKAFKLLSIAGAYWRGNSNNKMLVRIYGTAFSSSKELKQFLWAREEAKKRDHRKLGKELGLFTFAPEAIGQGLPLWLPKGTVIREELEQWAKQVEHQAGYYRVVTPIIGKESLYECSGHLQYFKEDMYAPIVIEDEHYYLRPMNCPHHHHVYQAEKRSYRDLPFRIAEYGNAFRYEASGALSGLMRTRGFCQNDAHIYCRADQVEEEFIDVLKLYMHYYDTLGIQDYYMRLSKPDLTQQDKYIHYPEEWEKALVILRNAMKKVAFPYIEVDGEAAFYGPKIDVQIKSAIGTEYTISTNQLDFLSAKRFGLHYVGADGVLHEVYVIHRAPLGSHERMIAYLIEHYAGAFPLWLSPVQVSIVPVTDSHLPYCQTLYETFKKAGIRVELNESNERMNYKIRQAVLHKIPYVAIIGDAEVESQTISIRVRTGEQNNKLRTSEFINMMNQYIASKSLKLWE